MSRQLRILLQFSLIAENPIGEQQNVKAAKRLRHLAELRSCVRVCTIERPWRCTLGAPRLQIAAMLSSRAASRPTRIIRARSAAQMRPVASAMAERRRE